MSDDGKEPEEEEGLNTGDDKLIFRLKDLYKKAGKKPYAEERHVFPSALITVHAVDLKTQTFDVEFQLRLFWKQPELNGFAPDDGDVEWGIKDDQKSIPVDIDDPFEDDLALEWIQQEYAFDSETDVVEMLVHCTDKFSERMELYRFPLDRQFLNILFAARAGEEEGNWTWITKAPQWVPEEHREVVQARLGPSMADYNMYTPWADFRILEETETNPDDVQPPFKFRMRVERKTEYYVAQIITPMLFIVTCCFTCFWVPSDADSVADRLGVTVNLLLAATFFRFLLGEMLPPVSYLTWMDYYITLGFVITTFFILENAMAPTFSNPDTVDQVFATIAAAIWGLANLFIFFATRTEYLRVSWQTMDEEDRAPNEEDNWQAGDKAWILGDKPDKSDK